MKIFGDSESSGFRNLVQQPGLLFGTNDVLEGPATERTIYTFSFFGNSVKSSTHKPKVYLHIAKDAWSTFTGKVRESCLPWLWKTAYLDDETGAAPRQILVCTWVEDGELSNELGKIIGKTWFVTNLIKNELYDEIFGQEFIRLKGTRANNTVIHGLGDFFGRAYEYNTDLLCPLYRSRDFFSAIRYTFLKHFSTTWKEVSIKVGQVSENVLIKTKDEAAISRLGIIA